MAKILLIETSTTQCSVALAEGGTPVAWKEERAEQGYVHAERLMPFVDAVLHEQGWSRTDLDAVAVSGGPGSFTGLRIGVSTAKGLCQAFQSPSLHWTPWLCLQNKASGLTKHRSSAWP